LSENLRRAEHLEAVLESFKSLFLKKRRQMRDEELQLL